MEEIISWMEKNTQKCDKSSLQGMQYNHKFMGASWARSLKVKNVFSGWYEKFLVHAFGITLKPAKQQEE